HVLRGVPGVEVTEDLDGLLRAAEAEVFARGRLLAEADQASLTEYRNLEAAEPVPALVLILPAPARPGPAARLAGILAIGRARDLGALLLGTWPHGTSCRIDATNTITQTTPPEQLGPLRPGLGLHHLSAAELTGLVGGLLADARGALDFLPTPT